MANSASTNSVSTMSASSDSASGRGKEQALVEILSVATALSGATDLSTLLHRILTTSRQLANSDAGSIFLVERADPHRDPQAEDQLWFAVSQNDSVQIAEMEEPLLAIRYPLTAERLVG